MCYDKAEVNYLIASSPGIQQALLFSLLSDVLLSQGGGFI
jgi:hypothetical protein